MDEKVTAVGVLVGGLTAGVSFIAYSLYNRHLLRGNNAPVVQSLANPNSEERGRYDSQLAVLGTLMILGGGLFGAGIVYALDFLSKLHNILPK